ncbi:MAG TPA: serine hydrolase [Gemmatimonadales bacterium]|jgi:CubicO group peptidase (beta-lactamase class C family)
MWRSLTAAAGMAALMARGGAAQAQAPDTARLRREVPELLRVSGVPGLSLALVRGGEVVWSAAFGTVNDSTGRPLEPGTVFEAASLSKPVFAYLVLRLADRGEFDLDRPLLDLLEYPRLARDPRARKITARIVLAHATGLPNWGGDTLRLRFDPGTDYGYSGEGFLFLQKALERTTGLSLDALARREVFRPLGMTHSSYVWQPRFSGAAAWATDWLWRVAPVNRYADGNAAASLVTTAGDYARFVAAVLTGRGLSAGIWREFLAPVRETEPGIHIALGIRVEEGPSSRRFFHSGSNGRRFTCYMSGDLATGIGLVFFTGAYDGTTLVRPIASSVFGESHPSRHWEWFDRYDDPRRLAFKSVQRAAVERGADAARERLRIVQASPPTRLSFDDILELGAFLSGRGLDPLAIEVLQAAVADSPDSAAAHLALGEALESAGDLERAIESYRRASALDGGGEAGRHLRWAGERVAARARRVAIPTPTLASYTGDYRERTVVLRDGRLHYGGGAAPESPLVPMGADLFELEKDPSVRVRFVGDGARSAPELVAIYRDGSVDRWLRAR